MFINEVEHIVGLSKKSIRYYEENGLLTPKRNHENDYRIYDDEDIKKLKIIKFLDVPIRDLQALNQGTLTLQDCMNDRIQKIQEQEEKYSSVKTMCIEISNSNDHFEDIDITKYFHKINTLNKEGFTMRNVKTSHAKKIVGAIVSSLIFSLFFLFIIGIITYFQITEVEKIPWVVYGFICQAMKLQNVSVW